MQSTPRDYAVLNGFEFERKPIAMKFLLNRPDGIEEWDRAGALCEFFRLAQDRGPFYCRQKNFTCVDSLVMGMKDPEPIFEAGEIGPSEGIYQEARANRRIYQYIPKLARNTVRYVAFSPVDSNLPFDPDIVVFTANVRQAEILMRGLAYSTGKPLAAKTTPVLLCSWLFIYPFVTGEANYSVTGLGYGMKSRNLFPEGLMLISVPYDLLPMLAGNLEKMEWELPMWRMTGDEKDSFFKKNSEKIRQRYLNG